MKRTENVPAVPAIKVNAYKKPSRTQQFEMRWLHEGFFIM